MKPFTYYILIHSCSGAIKFFFQQSEKCPDQGPNLDTLACHTIAVLFELAGRYLPVIIRCLYCTSLNYNTIIKRLIIKT